MTKDDMLISTRGAEGYSVESDLDMTVALDVTLTEELLIEGGAREIISKVQTLRKTRGLEVTDRITLLWSGDEFIEKVFAAHGERIAKVTLATSVARLNGDRTGAESSDVNGHTAVLAVEKC